jgi:hypothetical protein
MYQDDYGRAWDGPFLFTRSDIRQHAPRCYGVYQVISVAMNPPMVAYIGIATSAATTIRGRLLSHVSGNGNWALGRLGNPQDFRFVYYECDLDSARQIESHVVTTKKPPFNVRPEYQAFIPSIAVH